MFINYRYDISSEERERKFALGKEEKRKEEKVIRAGTNLIL